MGGLWTRRQGRVSIKAYLQKQTAQLDVALMSASPSRQGHQRLLKRWKQLRGAGWPLALADPTLPAGQRHRRHPGHHAPLAVVTQSTIPAFRVALPKNLTSNGLGAWKNAAV